MDTAVCNYRKDKKLVRESLKNGKHNKRDKVLGHMEKRMHDIPLHPYFIKLKVVAEYG